MHYVFWVTYCVGFSQSSEPMVTSTMPAFTVLWGVFEFGSCGTVGFMWSPEWLWAVFLCVLKFLIRDFRNYSFDPSCRGNATVSIV